MAGPARGARHRGHGHAHRAGSPHHRHGVARAVGPDPGPARAVVAGRPAPGPRVLPGPGVAGLRGRGGGLRPGGAGRGVPARHGRADGPPRPGGAAARPALRRRRPRGGPARGGHLGPPDRPGPHGADLAALAVRTLGRFVRLVRGARRGPRRARPDGPERAARGGAAGRRVDRRRHRGRGDRGRSAGRPAPGAAADRLAAHVHRVVDRVDGGPGVLRGRGQPLLGVRRDAGHRACPSGAGCAARDVVAVAAAPAGRADRRRRRGRRVAAAGGGEPPRRLAAHPSRQPRGVPDAVHAGPGRAHRTARRAAAARAAGPHLRDARARHADGHRLPRLGGVRRRRRVGRAGLRGRPSPRRARD